MGDEHASVDTREALNTILPWARNLVAVVVFVSTVVGTGAYYAADVIREFRSHTIASEKRDINQDVAIGVLDTKYDKHETRIDGVEMSVAMLGPAAADREVERATKLVQEAVDCEKAIGDVSRWVSVPAASGDYLSDELRVRVEEHFRRLGYEVSRERQLPSGRLRCFWIFVKQANEV